MNRVLLPLLCSVVMLLAGCDQGPPKPQTEAANNDKVATNVVEKLVRHLPASAAETKAKADALAAQMQQRAYLALAQGRLALNCDGAALQNAFEQAVCREQGRAGAEFLPFIQERYSKRSSVLSRREDIKNPWRWRVASETCWSADCNQAKHLRSIAQQCGSPVPNALQGQCVNAGEIW